MYSTYQPPIMAKDESHVFRMTGSHRDVVRTCKVTLSAAGFNQFTAYGSNFFCSRELEATTKRLMIYVQVDVLNHELCEVSFRKFAGMLPAHQQLIQRRLDRVQDELEMKAA